MSRQPIARSPDLLRLQNEGYDIDVQAGYLLVRDVPYVDTAPAVRRGTLVMQLDMAGDVAAKPASHVAFWIGDHPCHSTGAKITSIQNASQVQDLGGGLRIEHTFSAKADYRDYHHKVSTYVGRIEGEAVILDPTATAKTFPVIAEADAEGIFNYIDTATSRAGIGTINAKLKGQRIGIIGLGGTGAYILDLVAKTSVAEIHILDGDTLLNHNAFRTPGAPTIEQLRQKPLKVDHLGRIYDAMRKGIIRHRFYIDATNIALLDGLDFVFVCMDRGKAKRIAIEHLVANRTPFIEVGMGVVVSDGSLGGIVRLVSSTPDTREQAARHVSYAEDDGGANAYATNIQIAELNALNAALAVIRWKQHNLVYQDSRHDHYRGYSIASGQIVAEGSR